MSHRDNLLLAARTCLLERGYARTSVRDLVAESGANQASINYHFGSKDRLLNQVLLDLNREWGLLLFEALDSGGDHPAAPVPAERLVTLWRRVIDSIRTHERLWFLNFESISYVERDLEIRRMNADGQAMSRDALAAAFAGLGPTADPEERRVVGSHYYALLVGVALQWLTDPARAPSAADVAAADARTGGGLDEGR